MWAWSDSDGAGSPDKPVQLPRRLLAGPLDVSFFLADRRDQA
jgi:hypothetical protein